MDAIAALFELATSLIELALEVIFGLLDVALGSKDGSRR